MTCQQSIQHIRHEVTVGKHLAFCMADAGVRAEGMRRINAARRIARRLGYKLQAFCDV